MKPYIEILSREQAIEMSRRTLDRSTIIISISSFMYEKPKFKDNENILDVLYLFFDDTEQDTYKAMTPEQAKMLVDFVNKYKDDIEHIIVHCDAGISRSAGCAAAIMKYLFGSNEPIFNSRKYCPNLRCYSLVLNAFYELKE